MTGAIGRDKEQLQFIPSWLSPHVETRPQGIKHRFSKRNQKPQFVYELSQLLNVGILLKQKSCEPNNKFLTAGRGDFCHGAPTMCQALCWLGRRQGKLAWPPQRGHKPAVREAFYMRGWHSNRIWCNGIWPALSLSSLGLGLQNVLCSWNWNSKAVYGTQRCLGKHFQGFSVSWGFSLSHLIHSVKWAIIHLPWWGNQGL